MPAFKIVISDPKTRKTYQKEMDQMQAGLLGKKIRDKVPGNNCGLAGFELEITGGSDKEGFPMRHDVKGAARKRVLLSLGPGFYPERKGQRKKKSVRGNTISEDIAQVNTKIVKYGAKTIEESLGIVPKEPEKKEEAKPEAEGDKKRKGPETAGKEKTGNHEHKAENEEASQAKPEKE